MPLRPAMYLAACWLVLAASLAAQSPRDRHVVGPEAFTMRVVASALENPWGAGVGTRRRPVGHRAHRLPRHPARPGRRFEARRADADRCLPVGRPGRPARYRVRSRSGWARLAFVVYTYDRDPGPDVVRRIRVRRYTYDGGTRALTAPVDVLDNMPAHDDHGAGRLVVGTDGKLYFSRGDQGSNFLANYCNPNRAQDVPKADEVGRRDWSTYQGKILRMSLDGSIPADNPQFAGVRSHIYAIGLRNTQGLVFGPAGLLYGSDHGPSSDDELNVIKRAGTTGGRTSPVSRTIARTARELVGVGASSLPHVEVRRGNDSRQRAADEGVGVERAELRAAADDVLHG